MVLSLLRQQGGILLAQEREATGRLRTEVMYVLRNTQAFKEVRASPFYCWDTDVLLVHILLSQIKDLGLGMLTSQWDVLEQGVCMYLILGHKGLIPLRFPHCAYKGEQNFPAEMCKSGLHFWAAAAAAFLSTVISFLPTAPLVLMCIPEWHLWET